MVNQPKISYYTTTSLSDSSCPTSAAPLLPGLVSTTFNGWWDNKTSQMVVPITGPEIDISLNSTIARLEAKIKELEDALTEHILLGKENKS